MKKTNKANQMTQIADGAIAAARNMVARGVQTLDNPDANPADIIICLFGDQKPEDLGRHCARVRLEEAADKTRKIGAASGALALQALRELDRIAEASKELELVA